MTEVLKMECPKCGNVEEIKINANDVVAIPSYSDGDVLNTTINLKLNKCEIVFPCGYKFEHELN